MVEENKYLRTLTENAQQGKIVALEELYELNLNQVHTLVSRLAGNKILAEQLTKNILLRAWERICEDGPGEQLFSDWLRELSVHITVDELREPTLITDKKFKKRLKKDKHNADYSSDPAEKIIAQLDLDHRVVFVLNRIENFSLQQVSNFMGITTKEVETKLSESVNIISEFVSENDKERKQKVDWINLQAVIEPNEDILESTFEEIKEIRSAEVKEKEEVIEAERKEEIAELEKEIEKKRKEKAKEKKQQGKESREYKPTFYINKKWALSIVIPVIIFFGIKLISSSPSWSVTIDSGSPRINNEVIISNTDLSDGDIIRTNSLSVAILGIADIGKIEIGGGTTFKRLGSSNAGELMEGNIYVSADNHLKALSIKVPEATIKNVNHSAIYSVGVDQKGNSLIELEHGWLQVKSFDNEAAFPANHKLNINKGPGLGVPYSSSANFEYVMLLDEYLFGGRRDVTLNSLISSSTKHDVITLWNLLTRVNAGHQVENVYYKLNELAPHSDEISKFDILLLKPDLLNKWLEDIKQFL